MFLAPTFLRSVEKCCSGTPSSPQESSVPHFLQTNSLLLLLCPYLILSAALDRGTKEAYPHQLSGLFVSCPQAPRVGSQSLWPPFPAFRLQPCVEWWDLIRPAASRASFCTYLFSLLSSLEKRCMTDSSEQALSQRALGTQGIWPYASLQTLGPLTFPYFSCCRLIARQPFLQAGLHPGQYWEDMATTVTAGSWSSLWHQHSCINYGCLLMGHAARRYDLWLQKI